MSDVWVDKESQAAATERQRRIHVRYQRNHWLPGWIDHVEHETGGRGIVTITLFGGMDESLYDEIKARDRPPQQRRMAESQESTGRTPAVA